MRVYADNAATTKLSAAAKEAMLPYFDEIYGNPSTLYTLGQEAAEHLLRLRDSEQRLREKYPGFCWQREMTNPAFGRLVLAGVEPETAYAAVHRQELMQEAMRYAAGRTRRQVASSLASGARARENGGRSAAVSRSDPRGLDSRELADIRRRVMEGERISF